MQSLVDAGAWYDKQMKVRPLWTKAVTSSVLAACSSAVSQALRRRASLRELLSFAAQAAPPVSHFWFQLLDARLGSGRIFTKTLLDQVLFRPVMIAYGFASFALKLRQSTCAFSGVRY
ncbi:unnamed protein product [Symbiodinium pilosum]|uniref:Uncharacterized protein n=1 Tax=Symbiodinium pilosum TaxID=2952 RepID=A0A812JMY8_SYMPI|nr:unnamed protein product [Symbiodinium pilosum]